MAKDTATFKSPKMNVPVKEGEKITATDPFSNPMTWMCSHSLASRVIFIPVILDGELLSPRSFTLALTLAMVYFKKLLN